MQKTYAKDCDASRYEKETAQELIAGNKVQQLFCDDAFIIVSPRS